MLNRLNIKLLLPTVIVGVMFILMFTFVDIPTSKMTTVALVALMLVLQVLFSFLLNQKLITQRIERFKAYLDLVVSVEQAPSVPLIDTIDDELGAVTNELSQFIVDLGKVVAEIRAESELLKNGSEILAQQIGESVHSIDESANQIEQMAHSIEQIASTSSILSSSAIQVSETTAQVITILSQGTQSSNTSQKTIEAFAQEVTGMAKDLALLQDECSRIGSVLDVIRGIAEQTNLLALNAAIEAARAGEQGRGFAVVADEVRALAHRTQEATVEIQSMVEGLQEKSTNAVDAISRGQVLTQDSLSQSEEVVGALKQIGDVFAEVDNLTSQMASGTEEQQRSTSSINDNMAAVVSLSREVNSGLSSVAEHANQQQVVAEEVDISLNKICV
ncbi:methyl-accepting chemotaxis protein [Colwelliaceae bacterium 6471]